MVDYAERYARLSDEELLTLAAQEATLVELARSALNVELGRRRLQSISLAQYQEQAQKEVDTAILNREPVVEGKWVSVIAPRGKVSFPNLCPSCLIPNPDTLVSVRSETETSKYRVIYRKVQYLILSVPHCKSCARNFKFWQRISSASVLLGMAAAAVIMIKFNMSGWTGWLLIVPFCGPGIWASVYLKRSVRLVDHDDKWLHFSFKSVEYARMFHLLNSQS